MMIELIGGGIMLAGACVVLIGAIGLLRLPDFFCRLHSAGVIDTLGAGLVILGMLFLSGSVVVAFKMLLIAILFFVLSPVASHALAKSALQSGISVAAENMGDKPR